jgi:hypothetical protein
VTLKRFFGGPARKGRGSSSRLPTT